MVFWQLKNANEVHASARDDDGLLKVMLSVSPFFAIATLNCVSINSIDSIFNEQLRATVRRSFSFSRHSLDNVYNSNTKLILEVMLANFTDVQFKP